MIVDDSVIIENKTVEKLLPIHEAQLLTYLKMRKCKIGFLLNWNCSTYEGWHQEDGQSLVE